MEETVFTAAMRQTADGLFLLEGLDGETRRQLWAQAPRPVRFEKGEGIEKKQDDFAAEVASMAK